MKNVTSLKLFSVAALTTALLAAANSASAQSAAARPRATRAPVSESVRTGTLIAADGQKAVTSVDRKWDEKSGTGTVNEAAVLPDGKVSTRESNLTRESDGTIIERGTFTDFDGRSASYTETVKRTRSGQVATGRMVEADGKVATYETTFAREGRNQTKATTVITRADGTRETRVEILAPAKPVAGG
jgi:hypothetical protein